MLSLYSVLFVNNLWIILHPTLKLSSHLLLWHAGTTHWSTLLFKLTFLACWTNPSIHITVYTYFLGILDKPIHSITVKTFFPGMLDQPIDPHYCLNLLSWHAAPTHRSTLLLKTYFLGMLDRGVTIHFFHKWYVSRYLKCITIHITIHFIGNCNYSLKSMLVDMGAAMIFFYMRSLTY